jgi:mRNA-degrading endonuclease RelE of RelBE toxin-antitoxin system
MAVAALEMIYGPLAENPRRLGNALRFELEGLYVARRGDYRIIYEINEESMTVIIHVISHRADSYNPSRI